MNSITQITDDQFFTEYSRINPPAANPGYIPKKSPKKTHHLLTGKLEDLEKWFRLNK